MNYSYEGKYAQTDKIECLYHFHWECHRTDNEASNQTMLSAAYYPV